MIIRAPYSLSSLSSLSFLRITTKPKAQYPPPTILFSRFSASSCSSSSSSSSVTEAAPTSLETIPSHLHNQHHHPWPEWMAFVVRLKSLGYFPQSSSSSSDVDAADINYVDMRSLKDPCLTFARDTYDFFRLLSKDDIHSMVEGGCPKLQRKVVNSAKRLRVYVGLEEKSVCDACSLRGSCDRAYVMLGESEGVARMVDVMRLLLSYALDPLLISEAASAPSIEQAESAPRRLLRLLINLTEASTGLPHESSKKLAYKKEQPVRPMDASRSQDVEMTKGDWTCPKCSFMNFWRNLRCRKCNEKGTRFPKQASVVVEMKKGDWKCPQCECVNFASRRDCYQCKVPRPPRVLEPGEWECFKCDFLNFRRNITCLKCGSERRRDAAPQDKKQSKRSNLVVDYI